MDIRDKLEKALSDYYRLHSDKPTTIYLGDDEYFEVKSQAYRICSYAPSITIDKKFIEEKLMGLVLIRVHKTSYMRII